MASPAVDVLVTGHLGFIGTNLVRALEARGISVIGVDRDDYDLSDPLAARACLAAIRPRKVVHLAGSLNRHDSAAGRAAQWSDTLEAGRHVLEAAVEVGVTHMLVPGSVEELGLQPGVLSTDLPERPVTVYGLCKALLKQVAQFQADSHGMRVDWFRPFTVYGPGQRGSMLVPYAFAAAASGEPAQFTSGVQQRDFLYVDDLVAWIVGGVAAEIDPAQSGFTIHHLGSGHATAVKDVLETIAAAFPGSKFELGAIPRRPGEPDVQVAPPPDRRLDGPWEWRPQVSLADGLERTAHWYTAGR